MHRLAIGHRMFLGDHVLTFECTCGRVFAKKAAGAATHVELRAVIDAGVKAALQDVDEPAHGVAAHDQVPATAFEQSRLLAAAAQDLAAVGCLERTELASGRVTVGAGTTPNLQITPTAAVVDHNPS